MSQPSEVTNLNPVNSTVDQDPFMLLTVLMPCLNEAKTVANCIRQAHTACEKAVAQRHNFATANNGSRLAYEIVVADNGSTDESRDIAEACGARVIQVETKGYGAALRGGIAEANGKYVVMADSDGSYDFGEVGRFLDKLEEGFDLVVGNRFKGGILPKAMPWHHRMIGNPVLSGIGRLFYRSPCRDWHCGLRAFNRQMIANLGLQTTGMEFASEMICLACNESLKVVETPVQLHPDGRERRPHLRSFRDGVRHLYTLFRCLSSGRSKSTNQTDESYRKRKPSQRNHLLAFILLTLATLLASSSCTSGNSSELKSVPTEYRHDFGLLQAPASEVWKFELQNTYGKRITLKHFAAGCRCVTASMQPQVLEPGETASVEVAYRVNLAPRDEFQVIRVVFDELSAAQNPLIKVSARVRNLLHASESRLEWSIFESSPLSKQITVENFSPKEWSELRITAPEWLQSIAEPTTPTLGATQAWLVKLEPDANRSWGKHEGEVVVSVDQTNLRLVIPASMLLQSRISFYPTELRLGPNVREARVDLSIDLKDSSSNTQIQVNTINPLPELLSVSYRNQERGEGMLDVTVIKLLETQVTTEIQVLVPEVSNRPLSIPVVLKPN